MPGPVLHPSLTRLTALRALALLALLVLVTQLGGLAREMIDWDETTFILMGADVAKGNLPFVEQFDLKPPGIFLLIGALTATVGKSLAAIRLLGDACLLLSAIVAYRIAAPRTGNWPALGGAALFLAMVSLDFGQPTYSELPAAAAQMGAAWLLVRGRVTLACAAGAGFCVALAVLCRTNLGVVALAGGLLLLGGALLRSPRVEPMAFLAYGAGGLVPPAVMIAIYAAAGQLETLRLAMIDVPLAYSGQKPIGTVLADHASQFYHTAASAPLIYVPATLLIGAGTALLALQLRTDREDRWYPAAILTQTGAVLVSLLAGGVAYPHYWLQVLPFMGVLAAHALSIAGRGAPAWLLAAAVLVPCGAAIALRGPEAAAVAADPAGAERGFAMRQAADWIRQTSPAKPRVWALHKHLVLWYLDANQVSRAGVHPNNLAPGPILRTLAAEGYVGPDELGRVMASRPDYVVTDAKGVGLDWVRASGKPVDAWLAANYGEVRKFGDVIVYRRTASTQGG